MWKLCRSSNSVSAILCDMSGFIHSFHKYVLGAAYIPVTLVDAEETVVNKRENIGRHSL